MIGEDADMSGKGLDFLEEWINLNVTEDYRQGDRFQAKALAQPRRWHSIVSLMRPLLVLA
jgi:hypothetical protein